METSIQYRGYTINYSELGGVTEVMDRGICTYRVTKKSEITGRISAISWIEKNRIKF